MKQYAVFSLDGNGRSIRRETPWTASMGSAVGKLAVLTTQLQQMEFTGVFSNGIEVESYKVKTTED